VEVFGVMWLSHILQKDAMLGRSCLEVDSDDISSHVLLGLTCLAALLFLCLHQQLFFGSAWFSPASREYRNTTVIGKP
jgi:hypothetical protein